MFYSLVLSIILSGSNVDQSIVDYNLTKEDCIEMLVVNNQSNLSCELQPELILER